MLERPSRHRAGNPMLDPLSRGRLYAASHPAGAIAQLGERLNGIQEVRGSTPLGSTTVSPKRLFHRDVAARKAGYSA
jgi:hypothetical protein